MSDCFYDVKDYQTDAGKFQICKKNTKHSEWFHKHYLNQEFILQNHLYFPLQQYKEMFSEISWFLREIPNQYQSQSTKQAISPQIWVKKFFQDGHQVIPMMLINIQSNFLQNLFWKLNLKTGNFTLWIKNSTVFNPSLFISLMKEKYLSKSWQSAPRINAFVIFK